MIKQCTKNLFAIAKRIKGGYHEEQTCLGVDREWMMGGTLLSLLRRRLWCHLCGGGGGVCGDVCGVGGCDGGGGVDGVDGDGPGEVCTCTAGLGLGCLGPLAASYLPLSRSQQANRPPLFDRHPWPYCHHGLPSPLHNHPYYINHQYQHLIGPP